MATKKRTKAKQTRRRRIAVASVSAGGAVPATVGGKLETFALSDLRLDRNNPRLPPEEQADDQDKLLAFIAKEYAPIEIARSIAAHGYFASEPLIVVREGGENVVVEGNRRLAALRLLSDAALVKKLDLTDAEEWTAIEKSVTVPSTVPAVVAQSRADVAPIIGYRHISGIEPWEPLAKARFLASLVDKQKKSFEDVASLVGEYPSTVAALYRNFRIEKQAREAFGLDTSLARERFGVFTRAMQDENIRSFLKVPAPAEVKRGAAPLPTSVKPRMKEFLSWAFGEVDGAEAIVTDSRRIKELGVAVSNADGLAVLRKRRDLREAFVAAGGIRQRILDNLQDADVRLRAAIDDLDGQSSDAEIRSVVEACVEATARLDQMTAQ